jgi:FAD/FMN-containing dehydrogenase
MKPTLFGGIEAYHDPADFIHLTRDYRGCAQSAPTCILFPRSTTEVAQAIRICAREALAVVPQGGNTSLSLGTVPQTDRRFVLLNLARMNRIRDYKPGQGCVTVEAGCVLAQIAEATDAEGEHLGIALGSSGTCQIGGVLATNAGGENVLRFGMARDQVLGIEAVFADGTIWSQLGRMVKNNGGYDIRHLLCGSEGTLGVITAAVLRLHPRPVSQATAVLALSALAALPRLLELARNELGDSMQMFELVNRFAMAQAEQGMQPLFRIAPDWAILIDVGRRDTQSESVVSTFFERALEEKLVCDGVLSTSRLQRHRLLDLRVRVGDTLPGLGRYFGLDTGVPPHVIPDFVAAADSALATALPGARPYVFGHAGDGTVHYCAQLPEGAAAAVVESAITAINDLAVQFGGSATAEHGIGRTHRALLEARLSPAEHDLQLRIKRALDPQGLLNPGAVFAATDTMPSRSQSHADIR